ncbi:MAG: SPASM domain-containing protein, partial [Clostridium butyricum]|nr:SPASM domain-containing protein [Clostridium butyricum]
MERLSPAWPEFEFDDIKSEFNTGNYGQKIEKRKICPYIYYIMVINSDGTVSSCVGDWKHKQILGDLNKQSLKEVWNSAKMKKIWYEHAKFNKDIYA